MQPSQAPDHSIDVHMSNYMYMIMCDMLYEVMEVTSKPHALPLKAASSHAQLVVLTVLVLRAQ